MTGDGWVEPSLDEALDTSTAPFAGTQGFSGSDTSLAQAVAEERSASQRQAEILVLLRTAGPWGATVREVGDRLHVHHGKASAALSSMHKAGRITRLAVVRRGQKVYVLEPYIRGREVEGYGRPQPFKAALDEWFTPDPDGRVKADEHPAGFITAMRMLWQG